MKMQTDADNQFRTAMAILTGPKAAHEWRQAAALIDAAADAGHPDATERRAMLECKGVGRDVNWSKALDSLAIAAERGSQSAARQLILLADDQFEASAPAPGRSGSWTEKRSNIPFAERFQGPAGHMLLASPLIQTYTSLASAAECQWLIEAAAPRLERALIYDNPPRPDPDRSNRNAVLRLSNIDVIVEMIRTRVARAIRAPLPCLEISQVLRYRVGEEFRLHADFLDPTILGAEIARNGQRAATVLIYLNEDFEGGETSFPHLGLHHRARTGDALFFSNIAGGQPDPRTEHAGLPPTSGEKWVFSQWVRDRIPA